MQSQRWSGLMAMNPMVEPIKNRLNQTKRGLEIGKERSHHGTRNMPQIFVPVSRGSQPSFEAPQMAPVNMETLATVISNFN